MPDAPSPRKDKDNLSAIAKVFGYICIIAFAVGVLGLDDPRFAKPQPTLLGATNTSEHCEFI